VTSPRKSDACRTLAAEAAWQRRFAARLWPRRRVRPFASRCIALPSLIAGLSRRRSRVRVSLSVNYLQISSLCCLLRSQGPPASNDPAHIPPGNPRIGRVVAGTTRARLAGRDNRRSCGGQIPDGVAAGTDLLRSRSAAADVWIATPAESGAGPSKRYSPHVPGGVWRWDHAAGEAPFVQQLERQKHVVGKGGRGDVAPIWLLSQSRRRSIALSFHALFGLRQPREGVW
jgi:hypothetical protein